MVVTRVRSGAAGVAAPAAVGRVRSTKVSVQLVNEDRGVAASAVGTSIATATAVTITTVRVTPGPYRRPGGALWQARGRACSLFWLAGRPHPRPSGAFLTSSPTDVCA